MFQERNIANLAAFGSYKPKFLVGRILVISLISILLIHLAVIISGEQILETDRKGLVYLIASLAFNSVSEASFLIMVIFNNSRKLRWNIFMHAIAIVSVTLLLTFFWLSLVQNMFQEVDLFNNTVTQIVIIVGLLLLVILILLVKVSNLTRDWMENREEIDRLRQAKLQGDYNSLKDRLNPHFLFNNLSVLKSLIRYNPALAELFIKNFTDVYRYVLKSHEEDTVNLHDELEFMRSYIALHKERIGEGLEVDISVRDKDMDKEIVPMALQLLVENAIKHNIASKSSPLKIEVFTEGDYLVVVNNLNKKETTYSTQTGISTLDSRYKLLCNKGLDIKTNNTHYRAAIPLL